LGQRHLARCPSLSLVDDRDLPKRLEALNFERAD
jgi:hypothetical protein